MARAQGIDNGWVIGNHFHVSLQKVNRFLQPTLGMQERGEGLQGFGVTRLAGEQGFQPTLGGSGLVGLNLTASSLDRFIGGRG